MLSACSTHAELERPEDIVMIRGSYTTVSIIWKFITGGTEVCQLTGMENNPELLKQYAVILDQDGCTIMPANLLPDVTE